MPGPRKVRIFRDRKKSPNWYVEWRDPEGRKHAESCGPDRPDAEQRAQQIHEKLRSARLIPNSMTNVLRLRGKIGEVPVDICVELTSELLEALLGRNSHVI